MLCKRCKRCNGAGKVLGMGIMLQDCDDCDASGKSNSKEFSITNQNDVKTTPKRTRQRKIAVNNSDTVEN